MNDRHRDQFENDSVLNAGNLHDTDAILELDRLLDALASKEVPQTEDPLFTLLSAARAELDAAAPVPAPRIADLIAADQATDTAAESVDTALDVMGTTDSPGGTDGEIGTVTQLGRHRHRRGRRGLGFASRAAATGGISLTGMVVAGGVAAALAVGGFSVAAYHGAIPGIPALHKDSGGQDTSGTQNQGTLGGNTRFSQPAGQPAGEPQELVPDELARPSAMVEPSDGPEAWPSGEPTAEPNGDPAEPTGTDNPTESAEPTTTAPTAPGGASSDKSGHVTGIEDLPTAVPFISPAN